MACLPECNSLGTYNQRGIQAGSVQRRSTKWCCQSIHTGLLNNGGKKCQGFGLGADCCCLWRWTKELNPEGLVTMQSIQSSRET